jgi:hypothetical protein
VVSSPSSPSSLPALSSPGSLVLPVDFAAARRRLAHCGSRGPWQRGARPQPLQGGQLRQAATPGIALALVLLALLVAPEQPADQEAICQRHNGAAACRVW